MTLEEAIAEVALLRAQRDGRWLTPWRNLQGGAGGGGRQAPTFTRVGFKDNTVVTAFQTAGGMWAWVIVRNGSFVDGNDGGMEECDAVLLDRGWVLG